MANNPENLIGHTFADRSAEEVREIQRRGGINSGKARREKRDLRKCLEILLEREFTDKSGNTVSGAEALCAKLFEQGMKGNVKAFETLRDTVGQKMPDKIVVAEVEPEIIKEVEETVFEDD